jgi:hypothetical protein
LVELGSNLLDVEGCLRLRRVLHDLLVPSDFESARLELMLGAIFRRAGYRVEFRPELPNGRRSDLRIEIRGQIVFLEVKRLALSDSWNSVSRLWMALIDAVAVLHQIPRPSDGSIGCEIRLSQAINDRMGKGWQSDEALIQRIKSEVVSQLRSLIGRGTSQASFEVEGAVRVRIGPHVRSGTYGPPVSPTADLERAVRKFLTDVGEQLHPDYPGILVCQTGSILDVSQTRIRLEPLLASQERARHASVVVLLPVFTSLPQRLPMFPPFAVLNPAAKVPARELAAYRTLADRFGITE